jgi:uncharacterized protein YecA (UPF0149 family)
LATVLESILPGRLTGKESYARYLPDLLEEFLLHVALEEGLAKQWEWTSAINETREAYEQALANPNRQTYGSSVRYEPDKRKGAKLGRNDPCPCGSGRKYKQCCLRL